MFFVLAEILLIIILIFLWFIIRKKYSKLGYTVFGLILWVLSIFLTDGHILWGFNYNIALYSSRVSFTTGMLTLYLAIHFFSLKGSYLNKKINSNWFVILKTFSLLIFVLYVPISFSPSIVEDVSYDKINHSIISTAGNLNSFSTFLFLFYILLIIFLSTIQIIKSKNKLIKVKFKYILIGIILSSVWAIITNAILPSLGFPEIRILGPLGLLIFISLTTYALLQDRFNDVRVIRNNIISILVYSCVAFLLFYAVYNFQQLLWGGIYNLYAYITGIIIAIFVAIFLMSFSKKIQDILTNYQSRYFSPLRKKEEYLHKITIELDLEKIIKVILQLFENSFKTNKVFLCIKLNEEKMVVYKISTLKKIVESKELIYIEELFKEKERESNIKVLSELVTKDYKEKGIVTFMKKNDLEVIVSLKFKDHKENFQKVGYVLLGRKNLNKIYTFEELKFIESFSSYVGVAISRALLYKQVNKFKKNLERQVEQKTTEVRKQNEELLIKNQRLEKLSSMRGEFLNIASHQLRTPVSVIRGYAEMLLKGNVPENQKKHFLETIMRKANKQKQVISDILNASEMDTGEMDFDKGKTKIEPEIFLREIIERKKEEAENKGLKLKLRIKNKLPSILVNKIYFEEAVSNLINNSLQYTKEGSITVEGEKDKDKLKIRIIDTGIGIPKKEVNDLFSKFKRGSNANSVHTDGSGLGLFIVKNILKGHGGKVFVEKTELGKGTTFTMELPVE